jgi:hypothetical protein
MIFEFLVRQTYPMVTDNKQTTSAYLPHRTVSTETRLCRLLTICGLVVFFVNFFLGWWRLIVLLLRSGTGNWIAQGIIDFFRRHFNIIQLDKFWQCTENNFSITLKKFFM